MKIYKCNKCQKIFKRNEHLVRHLNKKFDCATTICENTTNENTTYENTSNNIGSNALNNPQCSPLEILPKNSPEFELISIENSNSILEIDSDSDLTSEIIFETEESFDKEDKDYKENLILLEGNLEIELKNNKCEFCLRQFSKKSNLTRHQRLHCKIKNYPNNENSELSNSEIKELSEQINNKNKKIDLLIEENKEFKKLALELQRVLIDKNEKLEKMVINLIKKETKKKLKETMKIDKNKTIITNLNNGIINNTTNNVNNEIVQNNITIQFGKEDLSLIDNKHFINLIKSNSTGAKIITDLVKIIHFNDEYPQFQNVCMTDINRGKVILYDGVKWNTITNGEKIIPELIEKAVEYSYEKDSELREGFKKYPKVITRLDVIKKYTKRCDNEYLEELKEENFYNNTDNKNKINDSEQFIILVGNRVKELIYNEKDTIIKKRIIKNKKELLKISNN